MVQLGHLVDQDTYDWSQGVHNTQVHCIYTYTNTQHVLHSRRLNNLNVLMLLLSLHNIQLILQVGSNLLDDYMKDLTQLVKVSSLNTEKKKKGKEFKPLPPPPIIASFEANKFYECPHSC